jgi:hypothetical protein
MLYLDVSAEVAPVHVHEIVGPVLGVVAKVMPQQVVQHSLQGISGSVGNLAEMDRHSLSLVSGT